MKKIIAMLLAMVMAFGLLCGCGTATENDNDNDSGADNATKTFKVGIVRYVDDASLNQIEKNIQEQLDAKGKELGVKFDYEDYCYNGQADGTTLNQIAATLIDAKVDVIVPIATPTAQVMQAATEDIDIPLVFSAVSDPLSAGLVQSMEAPANNITGTSDYLNTNGLMDLIFAADPDADYIGLLYSKSEDASKQPIAAAKKYLDDKGIKYIEKTGTTTDEIISAADALIAEGVDAVFTPTDNTVMKAEMAIYEKFVNAKIPHYGGADSFALNGAFCGFGVDYAQLGVKTADMIVEILVNGADPAATPVQTFDNGIVTINTEICDALGYNLEEIKGNFKDLCTGFVETKLAEEFEN